MLSIHRITTIQATPIFSHANWVELTFIGGFEESTKLTLYFSETSSALEFYHALPAHMRLETPDQEAARFALEEIEIGAPDK